MITEKMGGLSGGRGSRGKDPLMLQEGKRSNRESRTRVVTCVLFTHTQRHLQGSSVNCIASHKAVPGVQRACPALENKKSRHDGQYGVHAYLMPSPAPDALQLHFLSSKQPYEVSIILSILQMGN